MQSMGVLGELISPVPQGDDGLGLALPETDQRQLIRRVLTVVR